VRSFANITIAVVLEDLIEVDARGKILDLENTVNGTAARVLQA
jgi:hypothetical protein